MSDKSEPSPASSDLSGTVPSPADPQLNTLDPSSEGSVEMGDLSDKLNTSSASKMDFDTSSASMVVNVSFEEKSLEPKKKKIKLSATQKKVLVAERERLKKEREELRAKALADKLEREKEKLEKEKERIKEKELKLKQQEEEKRKKEAEKERKAAEAAEKKLQQEKEKQEKLQQQKEERERKEREKAAKEKERIQQREAKEQEKARRLEEKKAEEERKKQEEERKKQEKEKELEKSRDVMRNFFHRKSKSNTDINANFSSNEASPAKDGSKQQQHQKYDVEAFLQKIAGQNVPEEELYLKQLLSGKIKPYSAPSRKLLQQTDDDCALLEDNKFSDCNPKTKEEEEGIYVFLQFTENIRPAYFGKRFQPLPLVTLNGRTPFKKENYLDYEVDSDDEWEEEGPGESLSGSESEAEKGNDKDDYEIDDFFVPHGYLSEEENALGDDSELDTTATTGGPHPPLMKEQALMAERICKFNNKLTPQVVGCIWEADREQHREQYDFLQQFKAVHISSC